MATSISKSVNYKQAAAAPDYQVAARPVDTFVSGSGNDALSKGRQVAAALEQASGAVSRFGQVQARKKEQQITNLELLRASNYASEFEASVKEFAETYDYSIVDGARPSSDEVWAAYTSSNPEYQDALSKLTTDAGRNALNKSIGNVFYSTYGGASKAFETSEEDVELGNFAMQSLSNVTLSASSPEFFEVFKGIDQSIQSMDRSPQEAKKLLMSTALRAANENGDFRLYSLLLGEVEGKRTILSNDEYDLAFRQRESVQSRLRAEQNRLDNERANGVKAAKLNLQTTIGDLHIRGEATPENMLAAVQAAEEAGVGTAASDADKILKAYKSLSTEEIDSEDMIDLYDGYIQASDKIEWLRTNAKRLNKGMLNTFLTQAPRENPYTSKVYTDNLAIVRGLIRDREITDIFVEDTRYSQLQIMFNEEFDELIRTPDWPSMSKTQKNDAVFTLIQRVEARKQFIDNKVDGSMSAPLVAPSEIRKLEAINNQLN